MQNRNGEDTVSNKSASNEIGKKNENIIKIEHFPLLQEPTSPDALGDSLDNNEIKVEEVSWWQYEKTDDYLDIKDQTSPQDDISEQRIGDGHLCDKVFPRNGHFKNHMEDNKEKIPYQCSLCDKSFLRKGDLEFHRECHTEERPYQCSQCDKAFLLKLNLIIHMEVHTKLKSYQCNQCNKFFSNASNLKTHMEIHTGDIPFKCSLCDKAFLQKNNLICHMKIHTRETPYMCSQCDIAFSRKDHLKIHMETHTGERPYPCKLCDKAFSLKNDLINHVRKIHKYGRYSQEEKEKLTDVVENYKVEYEKEIEEKNKLPKHWDAKRKKFVKQSVKGGYMARAIRELYPSLANVQNDDPKFQRAIGVARRALKSRQNKRKRKSIAAGSNKKFRGPGGGRKVKAIEVRQAAFDWFVDIRSTLKGRLPINIFREKCMELYELWLANQTEEIKAEDRPKFSKHWIKNWVREYKVSLLKPSKRLAISQVDRVSKITEFLKNVMRFRYYFLVHFKKEPVIISGDQMPLQRNKISKQKSMTHQNQAAYVKENYTMSRERASVYTQLSTEPQNTMPTPEILFKGKGVGVHINPPQNMSVQFAPKGSYRLENMLKMVKTLKKRRHIIPQNEYSLYILDDYSVHLHDELRKQLLQIGYVLVIIGGGITGDIQINDTHLHHQLKTKYREKECDLMQQKLVASHNKITAPTRDEMMQMLLESWETVKIDPVIALKNNFILNAFDGSEDYLVTYKLMKLVGEEITAFRKELLSSPPPTSIQELIESITPPKGVKIKRKTTTDVPVDEGSELIDCEGDEIPVGEKESLIDSDEDEVEETILLSSPATVALTTHPTVTKTYDLPTNTPDCMINADSAFLNDISAVLQKHKGQISKLSLPYYCQFNDTLTEASLNVKTHIASNTPLAQEQTKLSHRDNTEITKQQSAIEVTSTNTSSHPKHRAHDDDLEDEMTDKSILKIQNSNGENYVSNQTTLNGYGNTIENNIKVEHFSLLQESTSPDALSDKLDNNDIKVEEVPWWQYNKTDEYLEFKHKTSPQDDFAERRMGDVHLYDKVFTQNGNFKSHTEDK
ncbi:unnamed protein product [Meganyctiphanes norvegica]|uniref:C2H2-type domain-containing protein n=1 Tax=Meganyctiphanes norvegica TaxID=48144 RepID=A0AAV2PPJ2_MEGNR